MFESEASGREQRRALPILNGRPVQLSISVAFHRSLLVGYTFLRAPFYEGEVSLRV
jgi:hypothetical protein